MLDKMKCDDFISRAGVADAVCLDDRIVLIRAKNVVEVSKKLLSLSPRYSTCIGIDHRPISRSYLVHHVLALDREGLYIVLEARAHDPDPRVESITSLYPAANWHEREVMDMLGIRFIGHPEPYRLILPDDWPENVYPLRKDYPYDKKPVEPAEIMDHPTPRHYTVSSGGRTGVSGAEIPLGPYHPALHEPEYYELIVEGERIVEARYRGFFVHRGMEKLAESRLTVNQVPFLAERICGICGYTHATAYCQAVEKAADIRVPARAEYIRSILLEIERIHSHLLWFGVAFHLLGFDTGFMATWRLREKIMDLAELLTGNRKTYGLNLVGGVRRDIDEAKAKAVEEALGLIEEKFKRLVKRAMGMGEIIARTKNIGILTREDAKKLGAIGPHARASGIDIDARRDYSYAAYKYVDVKVPVMDGCDVLSRILVRFEETIESIRLIRVFLREMPRGSLMAEYNDIPELRIGIGVTEAPRGEDIHYVMTGKENKIYRWRPRAPSYMNLATVPYMLVGEKLANAPIIIASIDPCFSCTDHVVVIDRSSGKRISLDKALRWK